MQKRKAIIMNEEEMQRAIRRIALEIIEKNRGVEGLCMVGIQRRGVVIARRIANEIEQLEGRRLPVGVLDITFYRDDLSMLAQHPVLSGTQIEFAVQGSKIVLVDDVLYTGRTIRAAIDAMMEIGRPDMIQLAILMDRGHRELPIQADYVGKNVPTAGNESIGVFVREIDGEDLVAILDK